MFTRLFPSGGIAAVAGAARDARAGEDGLEFRSSLLNSFRISHITSHIHYPLSCTRTRML